jgi:hypothetical protein
MRSYELRPAKGADNQIIARFPGKGRVTFEFDKAGEIVHHFIELEDASETENGAFGRNGVANARDAAITYFNEQKKPLSAPEPRVQGELNFD